MLTTDHTQKKRIHFLVFFLLSLSLAGCGFHLKENAAIPASFGPVNIKGISSYSSLYRIVRNALRQSSIQIVEDDTAAHSLVIRIAKDERRVLSVDETGKVSEYELIKTLAFRVLDRNGNEVIEEQQISLNTSYSVSSDDTLAKNLEEEDVRRRMDEYLVDRMFRYIANRL